MTTTDPYWCAVCHERHVVPSIARRHEQNADRQDHTTPVGRRPAAPAPDNERNVTGL